ncbi:transmembrane protein 225B [Orycteropus afer afer]|uniref:Transmembrane protein 225B n=1 Tax=Orycteropus afer afer TaxID=1230840 RepID=A0A8B7B1L1_ORYAF|nr:transmembrane protein 225B [Orycteropus afer afer]
MLNLDGRSMKGFSWAMAPALTSLGYLLILLVSIFPFWVRLRNEESYEEYFSGLFENCFHIKCWKPRPLSIYILLGRIFLLSAVVLSFLTTFIMVSFASQLFPRIRKHNFVSASVSFLTGACAFLALLLHALEIRKLRMQPSPPQFTVQWPYYILGFAIFLFIVAASAAHFRSSEGTDAVEARLSAGSGLRRRTGAEVEQATGKGCDAVAGCPAPGRGKSTSLCSAPPARGWFPRSCSRRHRGPVGPGNEALLVE